MTDCSRWWIVFGLIAMVAVMLGAVVVTENPELMPPPEYSIGGTVAVVAIYFVGRWFYRATEYLSGQ